MAAIVSAIFLCVVCAIHVTGADACATDTIVGVISFTGAIVLVNNATDAIFRHSRHRMKGNSSLIVISANAVRREMK